MAEKEIMEKMINNIKNASSPAELPFDENILRRDTVTHSMQVQDTVKRLTPLDSFKIPLLVFSNNAEFNVIKRNFGELAKKGIVVAISHEMFETLHGQDIQRTRAYVSTMTRHNDKLGYDWDKPSAEYVRSISSQFKESAYGPFVKEAANFYKNDNDMKGHHETLDQMTKMYGQSRQALLPDS